MLCWHNPTLASCGKRNIASIFSRQLGQITKHARQIRNTDKDEEDKCNFSTSEVQDGTNNRLWNATSKICHVRNNYIFQYLHLAASKSGHT